MNLPATMASPLIRKKRSLDLEVIWQFVEFSYRKSSQNNNGGHSRFDVSPGEMNIIMNYDVQLI